ncbi:MAG: hypothetical protein LBU72_04825 [Burkholderiaceae bacterium]|jgi:membrane-bound metal-dependent hydrolase YbcI (DUF457 family)|nr:hypothetical protein [Burkholderiaceae bacterium]
MFIGHFGVGFAAKAGAPRVSLGTLFLAADWPDLLWPTLLLLGVERVRIVPGATRVTPLLFEHYPVSHGLLAVIVWAAVAAAAYFYVRRNRKGALMLAVLVVSHWVLDAIVHQPDLPLFPGSDRVVGLNAWSSLPLTLAIEVSLFVLGVWCYARVTVPRDAPGRWGLWGLVLLLLAIYAGNLFGPPPPSAQAVAWTGQAQWLLVAWGYWLDRHRQTTVLFRAA